MKKHLSVGATLSSLLVISCAVGIISFQGCQKQDYVKEEPLDPVLLNSPELAEYIVSGAEYKQALTIFMAEIQKINFSKLEFVENSNGAKVAHLPVSVNIEEKAQVFNEKKESLFTKYPRFASFTEDIKKEYFLKCIRSSGVINVKLLELGINVNRPMTKGDPSEVSSGNLDSDDIMKFLEYWADNKDNEVIVIVFSDGTAMWYYTEGNGPTNSWTPLIDTLDGKRDYKGKRIAQMIHSQPSSSDPSQEDLDARLSEITYFIYNGNELHNYTDK